MPRKLVVNEDTQWLESLSDAELGAILPLSNRQIAGYVSVLSPPFRYIGVKAWNVLSGMSPDEIRAAASALLRQRATQAKEKKS